MYQPSTTAAQRCNHNHAGGYRAGARGLCVRWPEHTHTVAYRNRGDSRRIDACGKANPDADCHAQRDRHGYRGADGHTDGYGIRCTDRYADA